MSHIYFVRDGLKAEIEKREKQLEVMNPNSPYSYEYLDEAESVRRKMTIEILQQWLRENKALLSHLELCCKEAADASWTINPERMGQ